MVVCFDEKTNLQPRPRLAPTLPTRPGSPTRLEHEYKRAGALHLFAAFDTRTGKVYARTEMRKRQVSVIAFLSQLEQELPVAKTRVYLVMDNLKMHKGKQVQAWLATHPPFRVPLCARPLFVDESGGAMVQHCATQAASHQRLHQPG